MLMMQRLFLFAFLSVSTAWPVSASQSEQRGAAQQKNAKQNKQEKKKDWFDDKAVEVEEVEGQDIELKWLDQMHANWSTRFETTAQQIDGFFADEEDDEVQDAKVEARLKLGWEPRSRDWSELNVRFRLRVRLPKLEDRVDVLLSDIEDEDLDGSVSTIRDDAFSQDDSYNLSLRYRVSPNAKVSTKVGIGRTDQVYVRTRYRDFGSFTDSTSYRYQSSINYYSQDAFGADLGFTIDHELTPVSVLRFNTRFFYSRDESKDWTWRHRLEHLRILDDRSALILGAYVDGSDNPNYRLDQGLLYARWRKNALRKWLFFEIEPFMIWYRDEDFDPSYGLALRVEGYYGKL